MRKPRLKEVKHIVYGHTASKSRSGIGTQDSLTPRPYSGLNSASPGSWHANWSSPTVLTLPALASIPSESLHIFQSPPASNLGSLQQLRFRGPLNCCVPHLVRAPECSICSALKVTVPPVHPRICILYHHITSLNASQHPEKDK